ncbi:hypothetical protein Tsubulata_048212 [Turnera subulata]|uniref:Uncharacterized protein n=1 Tax=Turnera subulata TaxID=218843 RepID=A0A9Q0IVX5_9ROSI|nr:hypothetical protein Tsubulata_048212 [Turnera subulata]
MCFQWWLEAPGGMSDLSVYELEDNVWDEISASDDHIVPHPAAGHWDQFGVQGDSRKKLRLDVNSADDASRSSTQGKGETSLPTLTKNNIMLEKDSWSHTPDGVFTGLCENGSVNEIASVSSQEGRMASGCLTNGNLDTVGAEFCAEDPILGEKSNAVSDNAYRYPLSHITQTDNDLRFFNNDREDKESNDLLYYGWPDDIGNFEDVDRMFR